MIITKKIVLDEKGDPSDAIIPYGLFVELSETYGWDLDEEEQQELAGGKPRRILSLLRGMREIICHKRAVKYLQRMPIDGKERIKAAIARIATLADPLSDPNVKPMGGEWESCHG